MIRDMLTLTSVQVAREVYTQDGMGGGSTSTTLTTLSHAAIWQVGANNRYLSDKVTRASTHVLTVETDTYTWAAGDAKVVNGSNIYKITGHVDDVMGLGEITVVGLEQLT